MTNPVYVFVVAVAFIPYAKVEAIGDDGYFIDRIENYKYMAALFYNNRHHCGATIISEHKVVTAAHCVADPFDTFNNGGKKRHIIVSYGSINTTNYEHVRYVHPEDIFIHPNCTSGTLLHDVAILWIQQPIHFGMKVGKIEMVHSNYIPQNGINVTMLGFRFRNNYSTLRGMHTTVKDFGECKEMHRAVWGRIHRTNKSHEICVNSCGNKMDRGDSGGPLVNGNGLFLGIFSYADTRLPGVFMNVGGYRDFLDCPHPREYRGIIDH